MALSFRELNPRTDCLIQNSFSFLTVQWLEKKYPQLFAEVSAVQPPKPDNLLDRARCLMEQKRAVRYWSRNYRRAFRFIYQLLDEEEDFPEGDWNQLIN